MNNIKYAIYAMSFCMILLTACKDEGTTPATTDDTTTDDLAIYKQVYGATEIYQDGDFVVIKTNGLPDHKSPYYQGTQWSELYEAYNGTNPSWNQNPNKIASTSFVFRIPMNPVEVGSGNRSTSLGAMGVALNGVALYNQYAGPNNQPLTDEINSFDQYNGHPQQKGNYHYHLEPTWLTASKGRNALLGFLLDGFPVYGPMEDGELVKESALDNFHGHNHATADYPDGIYHYHVTDTDPYINGDGFKGTPGTVTQ
ncbi:MAG: hypothetical protein ACI9JN_000927 [Bacteroidia bacterium]|jgi:hypothetical protein